MAPQERRTPGGRGCAGAKPKARRPRSVREGRQSSLQRDYRGGLVAVDRPSNDADAAPEPPHRWLTLLKLRLVMVKMEAISEKSGFYRCVSLRQRFA
jgi:hypothetical protein